MILRLRSGQALISCKPSACQGDAGILRTPGIAASVNTEGAEKLNHGGTGSTEDSELNGTRINADDADLMILRLCTGQVLISLLLKGGEAGMFSGLEGGDWAKASSYGSISGGKRRRISGSMCAEQPSYGSLESWKR